MTLEHASPNTPAHPAPPRPERVTRPVRWGVIAVLALIVGVATTAVGVTHVKQIPDAVRTENGLHNYAGLKPLPDWCTDVARVREDRTQYAIVDGVTLPVPMGLRWWIADQFAALSGRPSRAAIIADVVRINTQRRSMCPLGEDIPALYPDESCAADGHPISCERWVSALRQWAPLPVLQTNGATQSAAESAPGAKVLWSAPERERAMKSEAVIAQVVAADLTALAQVANRDGWWRAPRQARERYVAAIAIRTRRLSASLAPQQRRDVVYPQLREMAKSDAPIADAQLAAAYRLAVADDASHADCDTLLALSLATETDFKTPARIGFGTVHLDRRPTRLAEAAQRAAAGAKCVTTLTAAKNSDTCREIERLEARIPEIAPLMAARNVHDCDLEEVLGLRKGGLGARP